MKSRSNNNRVGFTLLELTIVVAVLAIIAGFVLPRLINVKDDVAVQGTKTTLGAIRDAICGSDRGAGYVQDLGSLPTTLTMAALFSPPAGASPYDPVLRHGWHGPYLQDATGVFQINLTAGFTADYGAAKDPAVVDGWNRPIVIQFPSDSATTDPAQKILFARLVSAGPDGVIQTPATSLYPTIAQRGDDVVLFLMRPDVAP